jgi:hypothetical protein
MSFPSSIDAPDTTMQGTTLFTGDDHSLQHRTVATGLIAVENKLGLGVGSATLNQILVGSGAGTATWGTTVNNLNLGTPSITGGSLTGTLANGFYGTPTINNSTLGTFTAGGIYSNGTISGLGTINWLNGDRQSYTLSAAGTLAFTNPTKGQILTTEILQNSTGGYVLTFPTMKWPYGAALTIGTAASAINTLTVFYDGTSYLANLSASYS